MPELRWNPLLEEWVIIAADRQDRTYHPHPDYCPLCPTKPGQRLTEIPQENFDIVVFENRFPSLRSSSEQPSAEGNELHPVRDAAGVCEVVVYSPHHDRTLATESVDQIHKLVRVWRRRFAVLGARPDVRYVFIFENKGEAIGVTLSHPHGQIYGFPYIPPKVERELEASRSFFERNHRCLICDVIQDERSDGRRLVCENDSFLAVVPFFARLPYEIHIFAKRHIQAITDFTPNEDFDLAGILKSVLLKYDGLFGFSLPYMMVMHQRPTDGQPYDSYHFHIEFYPPHRTATKLKYLAGCESGAGSFINDAKPEQTAAQLRKADRAADLPKDKR